MSGMINEMVRKMNTRPQIYTPDWQYNPTSTADRRILDLIDGDVHSNDNVNQMKEDEELVEVHEAPGPPVKTINNKAGIGNLIIFAVAGVLIGAIIYNIIK